MRLSAKWISTGIACALLVACGGADSPGTSNHTSSLRVAGTAATGAPFAGGTVQVYGADGVALLSPPALVAADGSYSASIPAGAKFPIVFVADDGSQKLVSVMASAADSATVNVTQLTNLIAARISPTGDPANLVSEIGSGTTVNSAVVANKIRDVLSAIQPLLTAHDLVLTSNPISTSFTANGAGYDKMLDTLDVKIEPKGSTSSIELTVKKKVAEDAALPKVSLSSSDASIPTLPVINAADLPADGLSVALNELLARATACYALPKSSRIALNGTMATDITANECKDLFLANRPQDYKNSGHVVKSTDDFGGIFTATTAVEFSSPRYYYTVGQDVSGGPHAGDVAFGYRWKDGYGNFQYVRNIARQDTDGKYRFIGNQYAYPGGTNAYAQRRNFVTQADATYNSVGYVFDLPCNNITKYWKKINVTAPNGSKITLVPNVNVSGTSPAVTTCNYSYFVIATNAAQDPAGDNSGRTGTGFVRIRSEYEDATQVANGAHPRTTDAGLAFLPSDLTESQIEAIPQFGVWTYEYFTTSFTTPAATQSFKTVSRAMTIAGFRDSVKLPNLGASYLADLVSRVTCASAPNQLSCFVLPQAGAFPISWTVSEAAQTMAAPPATYRVKIYGSYSTSGPRIGFEDSTDVRSSVRSANIPCGNGDGGSSPQCQGGVTGSDFATSPYQTKITNIDLVSRLPDGSDASHFHTLYKLH